MKLMRKLLPALVVGAALSGPALVPAQAALVTYAFTATVTDDEAGRGFGSLSGQFSFDGGAADTVPDPSTGAYAFAGAPFGLSITFDDGSSFAFGTSLHVLLTNDLFGGDQWGLLGSGGDGTLSIALHDLDGSTFASDALSQTAAGLGLPAFDFTELRWEGSDGLLQAQLTGLACSAGCGPSDPTTPPGTGDPPSKVPEPGTLALLAAGSVAGLLRRRPVLRVA